MGTELFSHIGHALRTPLNSILGLAQILALDRTQPLSSMQKERVAQIEAAGWQLLDMISDLLDLTRIGAGCLTIPPAAVALEPVIRECLERLAGRAHPGPIDLDPDADLDAIVWGEPVRLKQVLVTLMSGALRHDRGGRGVRIGVRRQTEAGVMIWIRDLGQTMTAEQLERAFLPRDHLGAGPAPNPGTEVGLALTQPLIELMGGRLEVYRGVGSGCELRVHLLAAGAQVEPPQCADAA
jgi:signal transduction histidine kinase